MSSKEIIYEEPFLQTNLPQKKNSSGLYRLFTMEDFQMEMHLT